jgi:hypothetical protein
MSLQREIKDRLVAQSKESVTRACDLYSRIALNGGFNNGAGYSPLMNPDRRDIAAFIFFEVAAQYSVKLNFAFSEKAIQSQNASNRLQYPG